MKLSKRRAYERNPIHPTRVRERARSTGVAEAEVYHLLKNHQGACEICGGRPETRNLSLDHDHASGRVRGLLCSSCNTGLGLFLDDPARLRAAAAYLERSSERKESVA
jgi:hypothetical protein